MKKRALEKMILGIIALVFLFSCNGCNPAEKISENEDARHGGFASVIQSVVGKYGIMDEAKREVSYDTEKQLSGYLDAETFDITGDGKDELFLLYYDSGKIHMEVYEYKKGQTKKMWNQVSDWGGIFFLNVSRTDDIVNWFWHQSRHYPSDVIAYLDGEYKSGAKEGGLDTFTEEELSRYRSGETFASGWEEGDAFRKILEDRLGIDHEKDEELYSYQVEGIFHAVDVEELKNKWGIKIPEPRISPQQALEGIGYFGDKEKCKMTKEMATAYAAAIQKDKAMINSEHNNEAYLYAALVDVADDGMPLLLTATGGGEDSLYDGYRDLGEIYIWTWDGLEAKKYDFYQDMENSFIFDICFYEGSIRVEDGVGISVGDTFGWIDYAVSNAQITKENQVTYYNAYVNGDVAMGAFLPGVDAKKTEYGYEAKTQDLLDAGWVGDMQEDGTYSSLNAYRENGKLKYYGSIEKYQEYWNTYSYDHREEKYMIMAATTGNAGIHNGVGPADEAIKALEAYAKVAGKPYYSYEEISYLLTDSQLQTFAAEAAKKFDGKIGEIYRLSDDLYYITIYIDDAFSGGVIIKNIANGTAWKIIASAEQPMSEEHLAQEVGKDNAVSNIKIDYQQTKNAEKYLREVLSEIDGTVPNTAAKEEIADFAQSYISSQCEDVVRAKNNHVKITGELIENIGKDATKAMSEIQEVLDEKEVVLNKTVTVVLRIVCKKIESGEPISILLDQSCMEKIAIADAISIVLDDGYALKITKDALQRVIQDYGVISVIVQKSGSDQYQIQFKDSDDNIIEKVNTSIAFSVPANNELCTVQAEYVGGTDNWGGQFDETQKTLTFETPYSGTYTVMEEKIDISDITELPKEYQDAIRFMVSKGYFNVTDGKFDPNGTLTRYSFSEALVRMFFVLDRSMTTGFVDVPKDNPYYAYVASGEQANIIEGYEDNTFQGENNVLREEVIALCSRTLRERKGYLEPENPRDYLHFSDNDKIADWSERIIALAVRETLISDGGLLDPASAITRADSALILYRLFMLLYEVEPVAAASGNGITIVLSVVCGALLLAAIVCFVILIKVAKKRKEFNAEDEPVKAKREMQELEENEIEIEE